MIAIGELSSDAEAAAQEHNASPPTYGGCLGKQFWRDSLGHSHREEAMGSLSSDAGMAAHDTCENQIHAGSLPGKQLRSGPFSM